VIKSLRLKNFRSIHAAEIRCAPLTVIVGANGAGKSNLLKALDFISTLANTGLASAVTEAGARRAIVPKAIPEAKLAGIHTTIEYDAYIGSPVGYPSDYRKPNVSHSLELGWLESGKYKVTEESLKYLEPLATAISARNTAEDNVGLGRLPGKSSITFNRLASGVEIIPRPAFDESNKEDYASWFGLDFLGSLGTNASTADEMRTTLDRLFGRRVHDLSSDPGSLIDVNRSALSLSSHHQRFLDLMGRITQFDFDLEVLREEQDAVLDHVPTSDGSYMPSAVRWLSTQEQPSWERIHDTLRDLAPHVAGTSVAELETGREYVQFLETQTGRPVESWNASDGTLRALAILVALETTPESGVVMIEEPELRLHPWAVQALMRHIRDVLSRRKVQVILTTHSQQVLDEATPDEIIVASRTPDRGTVFQTAAEAVPGLSGSAEEIGRLWVKGLLGGVPTPFL
jgi:predicted ATPase